MLCDTIEHLVPGRLTNAKFLGVEHLLRRQARLDVRQRGVHNYAKPSSARRSRSTVNTGYAQVRAPGGLSAYCSDVRAPAFDLGFARSTVPVSD